MTLSDISDGARAKAKPIKPVKSVRVLVGVGDGSQLPGTTWLGGLRVGGFSLKGACCIEYA